MRLNLDGPRETRAIDIVKRYCVDHFAELKIMAIDRGESAVFSAGYVDGELGLVLTPLAELLAFAKEWPVDLVRALTGTPAGGISVLYSLEDVCGVFHVVDMQCERRINSAGGVA